MDRDRIYKELKRIVKGKIVIGETLSGHTSFKIGGPAEIWIEPLDTQDLKKIYLYARVKKIPIFVIGGGSNLLVKDEGVRGVVCHLSGDAFRKIRISGTNVTIGAGYHMWALVRFCCDKGLGGLESLAGIPGTIGGAVYMNAGGSSNPIFKNIGDFVKSVKVLDASGKIKRLTRDKLSFGYRCSNLDSYIILEVTLKLEKGESSVLVSMCSKFLSMKKQKQVLDARSAGCVFKNPAEFQFTCGQMIDMLGLKGTNLGGAQISEKHANFIINRDGASSKDVLNLITLIKEKVHENYRISLELEIKIV